MDYKVLEQSVEVPGFGRKTVKFIQPGPDSWRCLEVDGHTFSELLNKFKREGKADFVLPGRQSRGQAARDFLDSWGEVPFAKK